MRSVFDYVSAAYKRGLFIFRMDRRTYTVRYSGGALFELQVREAGAVIIERPFTSFDEIRALIPHFIRPVFEAAYTVYATAYNPQAPNVADEAASAAAAIAAMRPVE